MRIPAPILLVWVPTRAAFRVVKKRRKKTSDDRRWSEMTSRMPAAVEAKPVEVSTAAGEPPAASARGWAYRHRRDVLAPVGVGFALPALWLTVHLADSWSWTSIALAAVPLLGIAAAGVWWVEQINPETGGKRRVAATTAGVASLLWVAAPAHLPIPAVWKVHLFTLTVLPGLPWVARWPVLLVGVVVAVALRWGRFAIRPTVEVKVGPAEKWAATVGAEGPLAGTYLRNVSRVISQAGDDVGWVGDVVCTWGKHDATKVINQRELVVGAYGRDLIDYTPERTGNALIARIMLTERDPFPAVLEPKTWLNDDGTFVVGSYVDAADCKMRLFTPGAGIHDLWFFGVKGSGKSTLVDNALGSIMSRGWVVLHLTDLKGGMSLPEWREIAFRYGEEVADGLLMLRRLDAIGVARMAECARNGWKVLEPSLDWPIHFGLTEEAPQLWKIPEAVQIAERIETLYRAVLIALGSISQMAQLKQAWGNSNTLRTQAQAGNVGCGYLPADEADLGFDHFKPDMSLIKKGSYHWYVTSPAESREVLVKVAQVDSTEAARKAIPGVPNAIDLAAIERVEREEARRQIEAATQPEEQGPEGVTKQAVERALVDAAKEAAGPVRLASVAKRFIPETADDLERQRITEKVRYFLGQLAEDPTSKAFKPKQYGMYGVAS